MKEMSKIRTASAVAIQPRRLVQSQQTIIDDDDDENVDLLDIDPFSCASQSQSTTTSQSQSQSSKSSRSYNPRKGSAAWATLVVMSAKSAPYWLSKAQIFAAVTDSQLCQGKFAWRAVLDVAERGLIDRCTKTQRFALNVAGYALGSKLSPAAPAPAIAAAAALPSTASAAASSVREQPPINVDLQNGTVLLLIDSRELTNHPRLGMLLATRGVPFESRTLTLSDMLFVMSVPRANGAAPLELVMDFAAERKELPDFMASFYDGRYREQKHRLSRCGVNNVCYLVEGRLTSSVSITSTSWDPRQQKYGRYARAVPTTAIRAAMLSTTVHDKFIVRHTETIDETADYLASVYMHLLRARPMVELADDADESGNNVRYLSLNEFQVDNTKDAHLTVRDVFARQLMQVRGCSASRAAAIVALYPTAASLCAAYAKAGNDVQRSRMLAELRPADAAQRVGPQLSDDIFRAFAL